MVTPRVMLLGLSTLVCACTVTERQYKPQAPPSFASDHVASTHTWHAGPYLVQFAAGPHQFDSAGGQKSFSTFSVTHTDESRSTSAIATSAADIETFRYSPDLRAEEFINVFVSPSKRHLLISEHVPNDGSPCANYILFEVGAEKIKFSYLDLPVQRPQIKPGEPPVLVHFQNPRVRSITDEEVEFEYADKVAERLKIQSIPEAHGVRFP